MPASPRGPCVESLAGGPHYRYAYAAQPSNPAKEEVTVVVSAANSAARKRSRPSGSTGRDSRGTERMPEVVPEQAPSAQAEGAAGRRAGKANDELGALPDKGLPGPDLTVVGPGDGGQAEGKGPGDLDDAEDLGNFDDLAVDLEVD